MRASSPKASYLTSGFRVRALDNSIAIWNESLDFQLLCSEDVQGEEMGESMVFALAQMMEDGIVRDPKVSSKEVDKDVLC